MSLVKNLKNLTSLRPRPVITWDKTERIRRNKEIWDNKESIVHRLPLHYQHRYWTNVLSNIQPVHYRPPESRFHWDPNRLVEVETEVTSLLHRFLPSFYFLLALSYYAIKNTRTRSRSLGR